MSERDLIENEPHPAIHKGFLAITCGCGLMRLLPDGLVEGDEVELVPCLKCGNGFRGTLIEGGVQSY